MRPMVKTALRRTWRDRQSVQFGVAPGHAVVLEPVDGPAAAFLGLLDGTRGTATLTREAAALGLGPERVRRILALLSRGGVLDDAAEHAALSEAVRHRTALLDRLRPDLAALSVTHPAPGAAAVLMRRRRTARVRVIGAGRVGATVAALLSAAGVGAVELSDSGRVEPWDTCPGGIPAEHAGERRDAAGRGVVRRASPEAGRSLSPRGPAVRVPAVRDPSRDPATRDPTAREPARDPAACDPAAREPAARHRLPPLFGPGPVPQGAPPPVLTVLAPRDGLHAYAPQEAQARRLVMSGTPHLYTGVLEGTGVVGPLVIPGRTACGQCLGMLLTGTDPAWPLVLAQARSGRPPGVPACDVTLAATVAGTAAAHVLAHLDGRMPPSAGGRVELSHTQLSQQVRPVPPDPRCGCGAWQPARDPDTPASAAAEPPEAPNPDRPGGPAAAPGERRLSGAGGRRGTMAV
jgi:bacteriocin biosynthesis cyclodehydratase domain-containing protein